MNDSARTEVVLERRILECRDLGADPIAAASAWIRRPTAPAYRFLLATSLDGVTWGFVTTDDKGARVLQTSDLALPDLSPSLSGTLSEFRLFTNDRGRGGGAELHAWRSSLGWRAAEMREGQSAGLVAAIDETHILFGTSVEDARAGFTIVREGEGLKHAVPIAVNDASRCNGVYRFLRLHVRHYLHEGDGGVWEIRGSRLAGLSVNWSDR